MQNHNQMTLIIFHISRFLADLYAALRDVFTPHLLRPEDCKINVPNWEIKKPEAREVPKVGSNAKRVPGDARVFVWSDLATVQDAGTITPAEWGCIIEAYPSATPQLAGIVKRGIMDGKTHSEIAFEAKQRLDKPVSVSVVSKIAAPLSRMIGDEVSNSGVLDDEN